MLTKDVQPPNQSGVLASTALGSQPTGKPSFFTGSASTENYMTTEQLATLLGKSPRTLQRWEAMRVGPPRVKVNSLILYRADSVREWLKRNERCATVTRGRRP